MWAGSIGFGQMKNSCSNAVPLRFPGSKRESHEVSLGVQSQELGCNKFRSPALSWGCCPALCADKMLSPTLPFEPKRSQCSLVSKLTLVQAIPIRFGSLCACVGWIIHA